MNTLLADLLEPLRAVLGDRNASFYLYEDGALDAAVRTVIGMGKVCGYEVAEGRTAITPGITNPNHYALLLYHTARLMIQPSPEQQGFRTRAYGETQGSMRGFLGELAFSIHELENGSMFLGWQSFADWSLGVCGVNLWEMLVDAPTLRGHHHHHDHHHPHGTRSGAVVEQIAAFTLEGAASAGTMLLGHCLWTESVLIASATVNLSQPSAGVDTVLELLVDGAAHGEQITLAAGSAAEVNSALDLQLPAGSEVTWRALSAPVEAEDCARGLSLALVVRVPVTT
jgi:hypothetical protein